MKLTIAPEVLPDTPDFSTGSDHSQYVQLYADAVDPALSGMRHWPEHFQDLKRGILLVGRTERRIAGIALFDARPYVDEGIKVGRLAALATARAYRGQGIVGPALLEATIAIAKSSGVQAIEVQASEARAASFYERHEFETLHSNPFGTLLRRSVTLQ